MKTCRYVYFCVCLGLVGNQGRAQQPDSAYVPVADSVAIRRFLDTEGPAEAVFSFISPPPYRFRSGTYAVANPIFPLLSSPDSLVREPIERAHRQRRSIRISLLATAVPLAVLVYAETRIVFTLGSIVAGKPVSPDLPSSAVIKTSGIAVGTGLLVTGTFNIASLINLKKGIRRHNSLFGRKFPTIFNPKGL